MLTITGWAQARVGRHVLDPFRQCIFHSDAGGRCRTVVRDADPVENVVSGAEQLSGRGSLRQSVPVQHRLAAVHDRLDGVLMHPQVGDDLDTDLRRFGGQEVEGLAVLVVSTGKRCGVPRRVVRGCRRGYGRDKADLLSRRDIAVHDQSKTGNVREVRRGVAPRVGGTSRGRLIH